MAMRIIMKHKFDLQDAYDILLELCEWDAQQGRNEAPVWFRARKLIQRLQDQSFDA